VSRTVLAALVLIASMVVGCSGQAASPSPAPSAEAGTAPASEAPLPTLAADQVEAGFSQRIERAYCVGKAKAAWCAFMLRDAETKDYKFAVEGAAVAVVTRLTDRKKDRKLAATLCHDLVAAESSDPAVTFGLEQFTVFDRHGSKELATCDKPH
jgi:hypothetical protein